MKMRAIPAAAAFFALTGGIAYAIPNYNFSNSPSSVIDSTEWVFTSGGISITATGILTPSSAHTDLYTKNDGPGETGLGLKIGQPDHEISDDDFIQLDVSNLLANHIGSLTIDIGSLQGNEKGLIYYTSSAGTLGGTLEDTMIGGITGGVSQSFTLTLTKGMDFIDITAGGPNSNSSEDSGDVVLETASGHPVVPDGGSSAILLGLGLAATALVSLPRKLAAC